MSAPIEIDVDVKGREGILDDQCVDEKTNVNNDGVNIEINIFDRSYNNIAINLISYFSHTNNTFEVYSEKKHLNEHAKLKDIIKSTLGGNKNAATYKHRGAMHVHIPGGENDLVHNVQKERKYLDIPSKRNNWEGTFKNDHNLHSNEIAGGTANAIKCTVIFRKHREGKKR
ncbi:hypothetical protein POVCU2_0074810 [Plasmodium ovale curtisi]|uniref:Uncharacterized protein n=1 Tax=Plasmodium ovale curtisi TaxID=864141 RepID=A0A1A8X1T1_PLAOA|nr:hypothetical protein POVCU2_0074810 [Plasmodium ovale curtisi]SBS99207.1 hypothetical protein POVCU1_051320 [Plasmodium ovale curtisi]